MHSWVLGLWIAVAASPAVPTSSGEPGTGSVAAPERAPASAAVDVELVGPAARRDSVLVVIRELLGELALELDTGEHDELDVRTRLVDGPARACLATVIVDLRGDAALVYVADATFDRVLLRPIALPSGFDEVAREEVGAIVADTVAALQRGGQIGVRTEAVLPPPPVPVPVPVPAEPEPAAPVPEPVAPPPRALLGPAPIPPPLRTPTRLGVELGYRVEGRGRSSLNHALGAGGAVVLRSRRAVALRASLAAEAWLPERIETSSVMLRTWGVAAVGMVGLHAVLSPRVAIVSEAGVGTAGVVVQAGSDPVHRMVPLLQSRVLAVVSLGAGVQLGVGARLIADPVDLRILDLRDDRVLFDPWRWWPGLELVLGYARTVPHGDRRPR